MELDKVVRKADFHSVKMRICFKGLDLEVDFQEDFILCRAASQEGEAEAVRVEDLILIFESLYPIQ